MFSLSSTSFFSFSVLQYLQHQPKSENIMIYLRLHVKFEDNGITWLNLRQAPFPAIFPQLVRVHLFLKNFCLKSTIFEGLLDFAEEIFSIKWDDHVVLLSFSLFILWITVKYFLMLNLLLHMWDEAYFIMADDLFCILGFNLSVFLCCTLYVSLWGFGTRVALAS